MRKRGEGGREVEKEERRWQGGGMGRGEGGVDEREREAKFLVL